MNLLIAGGTDGLGLGFLKLMINSGGKWNINKIYVLGRHFTQVDQLRTSIEIVRLKCDITDNDQLMSVFETISDGSLDVFINTIGSFIKDQESTLNPMVVKTHFDLNASANINLLVGLLPKLKSDAQLLICLSSLCDYLQGRLGYGLQGATKVAYKYYLESLALELKNTSPEMRIMTINPSGIQTQIFKKGNDNRSTVNYATVEQIAAIMEFQLLLPRNLTIPHLVIYNTGVPPVNPHTP